ncbi:MAG: VWA domain-containing protein [Chloroflexaceae bacterium]|nr:VWA domain-containing protein [Chloroflexaceae bacterium]
MSPVRRIPALVLLVVMLGSLVIGCGGNPSSPPTNAVVVRMLYGSEKQAWLEAVTPAFNAQRIQTSTGKPIFVEAIPMGSTESMEAILNGIEEPAVWSPASGILLPLANQEWASSNGGQRLTEDAPPPLVLSPVVIAMWQPMAEALGWPEQPIGWTEIAELAASGKTWADYGRPEWGPFQFGHTHPDFSNSGIASIIAITYAATGKTRGLTIEDVQSPAVAELMQAVQSGVIHYGRSTGFFGRQMFNRGPGYLSAAVLYENLVVEAYDQTRFPNLALPIVAIYPREGTFWTDNPYAILDTPWMTDELREAATIYRDYLLAPEQQQTALSLGYRPANTSIPLGAPLIATNGIDPQEPRTLLEVPDTNVLRAIQEVWGTTKKRVEVQIVVDISGSMDDEARLMNAKRAIRDFIDQLDDEDHVGIIVFSDLATELTPLTALGPKRDDVLNRILGLRAFGGTRLIDTVVEAYQTLQQQPAGERIRALVVLSDGEDTQSFTRPEELQALIGQDESGRSIKLFTIAYGSGGIELDLLRQMADVTGGQLYQSKSDATEIEEVYRDIATFF